MWLKTPQDNYCLTEIFIKQKLRLLCGEADQLSMNIKGNGKDGTSIIAYPDIGKWNAEYTTSMSGDYEYKENSHGEDLETRFRRSMQAWYGMYYIPSELTVVDLTKHPEFRDFDDDNSPFYLKYKSQGYLGYNDIADILGESRISSGSEAYGTYSRLTDFMEYYQIKRYSSSTTLTSEEEPFEKRGYLVINFDIVAYKDGAPYFQQSG